MEFEMGFYVRGNILDGFMSDTVVACVGDESSENTLKNLYNRIGLLISKELDRYNEEKIQGGDHAPKLR